MDNELHALEHSLQICETCENWRQFDATTGFCNEVGNWHEETFYNDTCDTWCKCSTN